MSKTPKTDRPSLPALPADTTERLEARLERLEERLDRLTALAEQGPAVVAAAVDSADDLASRLSSRGVDVDARMHAALGLLERLSAPEAMAGLAGLLEMLEAAPGALAAAGDTFDGVVATLAENGIDVDERMHILLRVAERLTSPEALEAVGKILARTDEIHHLLDSGVFDEGSVRVVGLAARALTKMESEARPGGPLAAIRALRDPDVRMGFGAALEFGRQFGRAIREDAHAGAARRRIK